MNIELNKMYLGDCIEVMKGFPDNCIDSIVTDPPYGIGFMGHEWDTFNPEFINEKTNKDKRPHTKIASQRRSNTAGTYDYSRNKEFQQWFTIFSKECLRILKPGGHLLSFGGTRTYHRMVCAIEDAGFEIRDCLQWLYGSGFPKNLDISKAIDKMITPEQKEVFDKIRIKINKYRDKNELSLYDINKHFGYATNGSGMAGHWFANISQQTLPNKEQFFKLKRLLKFDDELDYLFVNLKKGTDRPIIGKHNAPAKSIYTQGEKELNKNVNITIPATPEAKQWDGFGTALKPANEPIVLARKPISEKNITLNILKWGTGGINIDGCRIKGDQKKWKEPKGGIWKTNNQKKSKLIDNPKGRWPANVIFDEETAGLLNNASRFFYCAKASKAERNAGLEGFEAKAKCEIDKMGGAKCTMKTGSGNTRNVAYKNNHPTVKPIKLMRYLVRLITPPNGICLDPFIGSGTTAIACIEEGFDYIGIEKEKEYFDIAEKRIFHYKRDLKLF